MAVTVGIAERPKAGENVCGDRCGWWLSGDRLVLAVADGLGHGNDAALASGAAIACIANCLDSECGEIFLKCETRLKDTRGAALAVSIIELSSGIMTIGTVGNIRVQLLHAPKDRRLDGGRGIVGGGFKNFVPQTLTLAAGDILAMFSDGLDEFPTLRETLAEPSKSANDQAQAILDRWARDDDDASVLIYHYGV
jgi:serine phosphatase RsbU (regulator of sigma subunit)